MDLFDWSPSTGRNERDRVLTALEEHRPDFIAAARMAAVEHARQFGVVTINDVRAKCPPPENVDPRVMGAVFRDKRFVKVGYENSSRSTCHARPIAKFRLKHEGA